MSIQTTSQLMTFAEFLDWKPENKRYEIHQGIISEVQPQGKHEEIVEFLSTELTIETRRLQLPYRFPKNALVKLPKKDTGYLPDILLVNRNAFADEPLWKKSSTLIKGTSIILVIEVVSSNWRDDYLTKLRDYEEIGINEYWIVDYLAIGGSRYIGQPKQPTISIYQLIHGEYQIQQFRNNDKIKSLTFPELILTANQIFEGAKED